MKIGDLVRLAGHHARSEEIGNNVGIIVSMHRIKAHRTARRLEIAIGEDLMSVHSAWVEVINESR